MYLRFVDLVPELCELGSRQTAVFVAVEALDEVQSPVLGVMQFVAQDRHRLVERDVSLAAETTSHTLHWHSPHPNASLHRVRFSVGDQLKRLGYCVRMLSFTFQILQMSTIAAE